MMATDSTFDNTALETIALLEARLKRIEYAVCGHVDSATISGDENASKRLADLEHSLHQIASKSRVIQELLKLHSRYPDLFQSLDPADLPSTLTPSELLSIVFTSASAYPATASRLTAIKDLPVPQAELSASLIELQPRIAKVEAIQASQNKDIARLRERTGNVLNRWYTVDVLRAGESLAELESRVEGIEKGVRRRQMEKRIDDELCDGCVGME